MQLIQKVTTKLFHRQYLFQSRSEQSRFRPTSILMSIKMSSCMLNEPRGIVGGSRSISISACLCASLDTFCNSKRRKNESTF